MPSLPPALIGTNVKTLKDIGVPLTLVHEFPYGGKWTYRTVTGITFTTDRDGVILPDTDAD